MKEKRVEGGMDRDGDTGVARVCHKGCCTGVIISRRGLTCSRLVLLRLLRQGLLLVVHGGRGVCPLELPELSTRRVLGRRQRCLLRARQPALLRLHQQGSRSQFTGDNCEFFQHTAICSKAAYAITICTADNRNIVGCSPYIEQA